MIQQLAASLFLFRVIIIIIIGSTALGAPWPHFMKLGIIKYPRCKSVEVKYQLQLCVSRYNMIGGALPVVSEIVIGIIFV